MELFCRPSCGVLIRLFDVSFRFVILAVLWTAFFGNLGDCVDGAEDSVIGGRANAILDDKYVVRDSILRIRVSVLI